MDENELKYEIESAIGGSLENVNIEDLENIDKNSIDWYTSVEEPNEPDESKNSKEDSKSEKKTCESYTSKYTTNKKRYNPQNSKKFKGGAPDLSSVEAALIDGNDIRRDIADLLN